MSEKESESPIAEAVIRPEHVGDSRQASELLEQLGYPTEPGELANRLKALRGNDEYSVQVAEREGRLVGMIALHLERPLLHCACEVRVMALIVSEQERGSGIGRRLLKAGEEWARGLNAAYICLNSGNRSERQAAHHFYRHCGYSSLSTGFSKPLQDQKEQENVL
ncbi:GNAT family N-acetyltransferase [Saccharibacillus deserti]|uniref:GNAT family N-acetyltransferase n=1 Tax=Saccharibacillus deserti TaxID=1634444 RepID=UPI0015568C46|nr:GNAT family N-acetyltransferase [Saccharibacillus deserti]